MPRDTLDPKDPGEVLRIRFNFSNWLPAGVTLVADKITVECILLQGVDANPAQMIISGHTLNGAVVYQLIGGGVIGNVYRVKCTAITSDGQTLILNGRLPVAVTYGNS